MKNWRVQSWEEHKKNILSELVSCDFLKLIEEADSCKDKIALKRQVFFDKFENTTTQDEGADPLGEDSYAVTPFLIHQYKNRVLLLATGKCFSHCRYCFRKSYTSRPQDFIKQKEIVKVVEYLKANPNINEILISGGDPLTASIKDLKMLLYSLREVSEHLLIRICTRAPIFAPSVFSSKLLLLLEKVKPLWVIPHINHPAELKESQKKCLESILKKGIAMQSQTVLLKGVNDDPITLSTLFHTITMLGIKPGYLFQLDMAYGTSHFRVPLNKALEIWEEVKKELSGLSTPIFAVDMPKGGGKFPLSVVSFQKGFFYDGKETITKQDQNKTYTYSTKNDIMS